MGALFAKFRKEKSTEEVLEGLEETIQELENYTQNTQEQKKRLVGNFLIFSIGIYVIAFVVVYFVYFPRTWRELIIYLVPLLVFPFAIIALRMLFTWYFQRKLNKNSTKLKALRTEKKKILEQVMDKETYKVAVNLLQRFGESKDKTNGNRYSFVPTPTPRPLNTLNSTALTPTTRPLLATSSGTQLSTSFNVRTLNSPLSRISSPVGPMTNENRQLALTSAGDLHLRRRTPFPIFNQQNKSVLDRIVDVLVGDGPQDRFAMICKECYAHNGMALKEEFDYVTFRCAFCGGLNPARKERPIAPRLSLEAPPHLRVAGSGTSSSASEEESDHEFQERGKVPGSEMTEYSVYTATSREAAATVAEEETANTATNDSENVETVEQRESNRAEEEQPNERVGISKQFLDELKKEK